MQWLGAMGAIVGCHCSVVWLGRRATTNFGGVDVVPLLSAIAIVMCYGGGEEGSGRGAIAGCHSSVLWLGGVTTNFGGADVVPLLGALPMCCGVDVVPLLGAIVVCYGAGRELWTWCHCWVPLPLQSAIVVCYGGGRG